MDERNYFTIEISLRTIKIVGIIIVSLILVFWSLYYASGKVNVSASVDGWFKTEQVDDENVAISTNMSVWVNGTKFVRCEENENMIREDLYIGY